MDPQVEQWINALEGKVLAMQAAIQGLIDCHPNPAHAASVVTALQDEMLTTAAQSKLPHELVDALRRARTQHK